MDVTQVIITFVDIRGFTTWSEKTKAFLYVEEFIDSFYQEIQNLFQGSYTKPLGDGLMIVQEIQEQSLEIREDFLQSILGKIVTINNWFDAYCLNFSKKYGFSTHLKLGWGIASGAVKKISREDLTDYLGSDINRASRLCSIARPYGVVVDRENFPNIPSSFSDNFYEQNRKLEGIPDDVLVYVTQEIQEQFLPREKKREYPEVHVTGICIKEEGENLSVLLAKRDESRDLFPGLYEGCGGQLGRNEDFVEGVQRHFMSEMGLEVKVLKDFHIFYLIDLHQEPLIPGIRFLCERVKGEPQSKRHSEIRWFTESEFRPMDAALFPPEMKEQLCKLLDAYKKSGRVEA
jgi:hypothetical protein